MKTNIEISKREVMRQVELSTAYIGAKSENPAATYQRVAAGESDRQLLDSFWTAATAHTDVCLGRWLAARCCCKGADEAYRVTLRVPPLFNCARIGALCHTLRDMLAADIIARWLAVAMPGEEARYVAMHEELMMQMKRIMDTRRKKRMEVV